jgi:hypothetical protein
LTATNRDLHKLGVEVTQRLQVSDDKLAAIRAPRPKIPTPRIFDGKIGTAVDTWIDEVEKQFPHFVDYFVDDAHKIDHALNYVNHDVGNWYKPTAATASASGAAIDTWDKFVSTMRHRYQPIESSHSARSSLDRAVQSGTVQAYSTHVQSLMTYITDMSTADQIYQYCRGLKPTIHLEVMKAKPKSLTDAIEKAVGIEAYSRSIVQPSSNGSAPFRSFQQRSSYPTSSSSTTPMDLNNVELSSEHSTNLDSAPSRESHLLAIIQQQQENQSRMQQQLNALFNKSQDRRPRNSSSPSSSSSSPSSAPSSKVPGVTHEVYQKCRAEDRCFKCKEQGHTAKECSKPLRLNW